MPSIALLSFVLGLAGAVFSSAAEQPPTKSYREIQPEADQKKNYIAVGDMLRTHQFPPDGEAKLKAYFEKFVFRQWTLADNRTKLTELRKQLVNILRMPTYKGGPVYTYLRDKVILPDMEVLAKPDPSGEEFHPAVRVNAMLMIGDLNETEPGATLTELPKPLPAAVPVMVRAVEDPNQIDSVKVAAMVGLLRHAKLGGAQDRTVTTAMLNLVNASAPPKGRTAEGHAWMRTQAAEILGDLRSPGNNADVLKALAKMVAESGSPLSARCAAARALGRLNYQGVGGLNLSEFARVLGGLAVDACKAESEPISRRRLKDHLAAVWLGLTGREWDGEPGRTPTAGIAGLATAPPHQAFVADVRQKLENLLKLCDDRKIDDADLMKKVNETCTTLEQVVKK